MRKSVFAYAITKAQISCVVNVQLISDFELDNTIPLLPKAKFSSL